MKHLIGVLLILPTLWMVTISNAYAVFNDETNWELLLELHYQLLSRQNKDGSWGEREVNKVRETALAISALRQFHDHRRSIPMKRALNWLGNSHPASADSTARALKVLWENRIESPSLLALLYSYGNKADGTSQDTPFYWGGTTIETANVLDTCLILQAFNEARLQDNVLEQAPTWGEPVSRAVYESLIEVLVQRVMPNADNDGYIGWAYGEREGRVPFADLIPTQCAVTALDDVNNKSNVYTSAELAAIYGNVDVNEGKTATETQPPYGDYQEDMIQQLLRLQGSTLQNGQVLHDYFVNPPEPRSLLSVALAANLHMVNAIQYWDSDRDGIDNRIEERLGLDPNHYDEDWLEPDEQTFSDVTRYAKYDDALTVSLAENGDTVTLLTDLAAYNGLVVLDGHQLTVTAPFALTLSYQVTRPDGTVSYETAVIEPLSGVGDDDNDGLPNAIDQGCTSPFENDSQADSDGDELLNLEEHQGGTLHCVADTDGDGLPDGWERFNLIDPTSQWDAVCDDVCENNSPCECDPDRDGLDNLGEYTAGTDPQRSDTDSDGVNDHEEVLATRNPLFNENINLMIFLDSL